MPNIFDTVLTKIAEADRATFSEIAARNPTLQEYIADPAAINQVDAVQAWYANEWDSTNGCTKLEFAQKQQLVELEAKIAAMPGEGMNLEQLNQFLDEKIASGAVVSAKQVKEEVAGIVTAKETEFNQYLNAVANASTVLSQLTLQHYVDHGEVLNGEDLLKQANEAKAGDLRGFYRDKYAAEKIAAKSKADADKAAADLTAQLAAAKEEGRKAALQEQAGREQGGPSVDGTPDLGSMQERIQRLRTEVTGGKAPVAPEAELGSGITAAAAARAADQAAIVGRAA